jgi:hypothetical protein
MIDHKIFDIEGVKLTEAEIITLNAIDATHTIPNTSWESMLNIDMLVLSGILERSRSSEGSWLDTWFLTDAGEDFKNSDGFAIAVAEIVENQTFLN